MSVMSSSTRNVIEPATGPANGQDRAPGSVNARRGARGPFRIGHPQRSLQIRTSISVRKSHATPAQRRTRPDHPGRKSLRECHHPIGV
jgi:hypothetical protein